MIVSNLIWNINSMVNLNSGSIVSMSDHDLAQLPIQINPLPTSLKIIFANAQTTCDATIWAPQDALTLDGTSGANGGPYAVSVAAFSPCGMNPQPCGVGVIPSLANLFDMGTDGQCNCADVATSFQEDTSNGISFYFHFSFHFISCQGLNQNDFIPTPDLN